ncbi:MAG: dihydrolipoyl dehydrogenase family protein, partial [Desulfovibrionales bacterium]
CDLLVLGAGPGGYRAALDGAAAGLKTVLVEKGHLGGTCLNWGCIPTKLFLGATQAAADLEVQSRLRTLAGTIRFDLAGIQKRKRTLILGTRKSMERSLKDSGIELITGAGQLIGPNILAVDMQGSYSEIHFSHLVIAAGSVPFFPPGLAPNGREILDSTDCLELGNVPARLAVIGAGPIGIELAQFWSRLGSEIVLVELAPTILPTEDPEIAALMAWHLKRFGWTVHTATTVTELDDDADGVGLLLQNGERITADKVLVSVGRMPALSGLGVENTDISVTSRGWIRTDDALRAAENVYAVGDVNGRFLLAHAAEDQARYVIRHILETEKGPYDPGPPPSCVYGDPEVFRAGFSVRELKERDLPVSVSRFQLAANPVAQASGSTRGMIKVIWSEGKIRGVTGIGHRAAGMVTLAEVMVRQSWTREEIHNTIFAHPTLDEALKEAVLAPLEEVDRD